jgi:membrane-bound lytic murein transglycosylase D
MPLLSFLILTVVHALAEEPDPSAPPGSGEPGDRPLSLDPEAPAAEATESLWNYIEGAPPRAEDIQATAELAAERFAELSFMGLVGAEPPMDYYLNPAAATAIDPLHLDKINPAEFDIPIIVNEPVKQWMVYFLGNGRKYYARYLARSTHWIPMMHAALEARGMPKDLVYLSMIESGFNYGAYSYASAVGLWQFMSGTGRDYKLRIDWWVDERRDPIASTRAALDYLSDLHRMFNGDWWLSWASYNGGQGRVMQATKKLGTTDFWKIAESNLLHTETDNYVPKLIAAAIIGKHPERYGFVGIKYMDAWSYDEVEAPAAVSVAILAKCAGMTEEEFLDYNPGLLRWSLPPDPELQTIRISKGKAVAFREEFSKIPPQERVTFARHVVKRGESLAGIAAKYGVTVSDLARVNRISNINSIYVGMELVIPTSGSALASTVGATSSSASNSTPKPPTSGGSSAPKTTTYTVKSGDTLSEIAAKYGVTVDQLKSWNGISGSTIVPGQKLKVQAPASSSSTASSKATPSSSTAATTYTVKSGDTLSGIAAKYGVTVDQLKSWNGISGSTIVPGQKLKVQAPASSPASSSSSSRSSTTYTVKRGDTLSSIAERYNCTVAELKSWNKLSDSTIYPGQKLKILK